MVSLAELREADLDRLDEVATAYDKLATAFQDHVNQLNTQVVKHIFDYRWIGTAAGAANASLQNTSNRLNAAHTEMSAMGALLREAAESFRLAQAKVEEALQDAQNEGLTVADDGSVSWPPPAAAERNDPKYDTPQKGKDIATRLSDAVTEASTADGRIAKLLDDLAQRARTGSGLDNTQAQQDLGTVAQAGTDLLTAGFPSKDATPAQVRDWWNSLTPDEQQRLINAHPDLIGNRDGIPSVARDQANRINLTNLINEYQNKPNRSAEDQTKLDGFNKMKVKLDQAGPVPPLLLLGIGDQGHGRAILSYGNPDTAQNVSALVPGLGTGISDIAGKDGAHAFNIWKAANNADSASSTASIAWLGYDPPPGDFRPGVGSAAYPDEASSAAYSYDQFLGGLRATHQGAPAHVTAIGHSYGSTVVGWAGLQPGGTGADDIVLIGSPGAGADKASQLNIDPGHVWAGAANNDPISKAPAPSRLAGDAALSTVLGPYGADWVYNQVNPNQLWFGTDPASAQFGAQRFQVADGDLSSSHSHYMEVPPDPKQGQEPTDVQQSIQNIGYIVASQYGNVTRVPGR